MFTHFNLQSGLSLCVSATSSWSIGDALDRVLSGGYRPTSKRQEMAQGIENLFSTANGKSEKVGEQKLF